MAEQRHTTTTHYGDWHRFAVCTTCHWEGSRTGVATRREFVQRDEADAHARKMHTRYLLARILTPWRKPVTHLVARWSGQPLKCCGKRPLEVSGIDRFTFEPTVATCGGGSAHE